MLLMAAKSMLGSAAFDTWSALGEGGLSAGALDGKLNFKHYPFSASTICRIFLQMGNKLL